MTHQAKNILNQDRFKKYLKKIGSGEFTSKNLNRQESAEALELMLTGQATAAQIGAFLIAHRIRRPRPEELAGMLDTYSKLGPNLKSKKDQPTPICFGMPFDGRNRISPIYPITTLILLSYQKPVVLNGGKRMPVKYGVTSIELFNSLGLNLKGISMQILQKGFEDNGLAFIYQPDHFPLAESLIEYRDQIGKRPPIASMELLWTAHKGEHLIITGYVHEPTEERAWETLQISGEKNIISIKGIEGGIDLPISRQSLIGKISQGQLDRLVFNSRDYDLFGKDKKWENIEEWKIDALAALNNHGPLRKNVIWNGNNDSGSQVSSGMYLVRMEAGGQVYQQAITLLK